MPLLTPSQLAALQTIGVLGMTDDITIQRPTNSDSVYGDEDAIVYATIATAKAWLRSIPTAVATANTGVLVTTTTYRLLVPLGTDIVAKDQVLHGADTYLVTDTTLESTWKVYLTASLRKRE